MNKTENEKVESTKIFKFHLFINAIVLCRKHHLFKGNQREKMSGWEINEYGGIDALTFNENIEMPVIQSPTEVLIEVYTTSVNPLDQLMTGANEFIQI